MREAADALYIMTWFLVGRFAPFIFVLAFLNGIAKDISSG